jgi:hypothetical protein
MADQDKPSDGAYFVTSRRWERSYIGHVRGDTTTLFTESGTWVNYDTKTLVNDGARFLQNGKDYRAALTPKEPSE